MSLLSTVCAVETVRSVQLLKWSHQWRWSGKEPEQTDASPLTASCTSPVSNQLSVLCFLTLRVLPPLSRALSWVFLNLFILSSLCSWQFFRALGSDKWTQRVCGQCR